MSGYQKIGYEYCRISKSQTRKPEKSDISSNIRQNIQLLGLPSSKVGFRNPKNNRIWCG